MNEIEHLNKVVKTRYKLNAVAGNVQHLREGLKNDVAQVNIQRRVVKTKAFHTLRIEKYLVRDELARARNEYDGLKVKIHHLYLVARGFLSVFDFVRFSALLSKSDRSHRSSLSLKYEAAIERLRHHRFGKLTFNHDFIINLSSVTLSTIQKDVLSKGTDFCIPSKLKKEETLAEFELLYQQLCKHQSVSEESLVNCRTELQYLSTKAVSLKPDHSSFSLSKEHLKSLSELKRNKDIIITRPDKGRATVILSKRDYLEKMDHVLGDESKFLRLGPVSQFDRTIKIETELQQYLKGLLERDEISESNFRFLKPVGSSRPRMYGLPKIHKSSCPLRPILSMSGSPQYAVSRWLCSILQPVLSLYSTYCVCDTFEFVSQLRDLSVPSNGSICSFDVVSLFTNVPLLETIDICCNALYHSSNIASPSLSEMSYRKLMLMVTSGVEFSFDDIMYRQVDGVAMGSPLGPLLANIFVGYCESCIPENEYPPFYCRFVDDSFTYCPDSMLVDRVQV